MMIGSRRTVSHARQRGVVGLELLAGGAAAVVSGLVWAVIGYYLQVEIGWLAIGVGVLVGVAVAAAAKQPSPALGVSASALAVGGIVLGKLLAISWSVSYYAQNDYGDEFLLDAAVYRIVQNGETSDAFAEWMVDTDAEYPPASVEAEAQRHYQAAQQHLRGATEEERKELVLAYADVLFGNVSYVQRLVDDFHPLDLLWYGLAIYSAWKIASGANNAEGRPKEPQTPAAA